ncbi:hypothetical protein FP507_02260 [Chlorobium phaeovibrioides]|uniref:Soluble ligand binding domain-containing protein n=2 Tax=Chlorobium phaeovibrioides TaxID=1094 RepID=A0A5M8ICE4_CHLPH|nr:hypothetical protein FP507_02260 [Chlorobium phaeovibrioides]
MASNNNTSTTEPMRTNLKKIVAMLLLVQTVASPFAAITALAAPFDSPLLNNPSRSYSSSYSQQSSAPSFGVPLDTYFTDSMGNILMYVNVLGEVVKPGQHIVRQDSDLGTIYAVVGGANDAANMKKVRVMRYRPEKDEPLTHTVNLKSYLETGDRSSFVELRPNDTIVIPKDKGLSFGRVAQYTGLAASVLTLVYLIQRD